MTIQEMLTEYVADCGQPLLHPDALRCLYVRTLVEKHRNLSRVARLLGLHRRTLQRMLQKNPDRRVGTPCAKICMACEAVKQQALTPLQRHMRE